jgi:hypothetical protein
MTGNSDGSADISARAVARPGAVHGLRRGLELLHRIFEQHAVLIVDDILVIFCKTLERLAVERLLVLDTFAYRSTTSSGLSADAGAAGDRTGPEFMTVP